jgi:DNA-binding CsgD family transcriptional regulator
MVAPERRENPGKPSNLTFRTRYFTLCAMRGIRVPSVLPGSPAYCLFPYRARGTLEPAAFPERHARRTPRQGEVALLRSRVTTNEEVARQLFLQERTVTNYMPRILTRLGCAAARQSVRRYGHSGPLLPPGGRAPGRGSLGTTPRQLSRGRGRFLVHQNRRRRRGDPYSAQRQDRPPWRGYFPRVPVRITAYP